MPLKAGVKAPEFELRDGEGQVHRLSDYLGRTIVVYFYPRDDTPGCTREACSFRDAYDDFAEAGIEILGISPDSELSHYKFMEKYELPFPLLSDSDHKVSQAYGVWGVKHAMGREYEGIFRTTFIIGPDGIIKRVFENVKPAEHSQEVLAAVNAVT